MENLIKKKYRLSLWGNEQEQIDTRFMYALLSTEDEGDYDHLGVISTQIDDTHLLINDSNDSIIPSYLKEYKLFDFGADNMTSKIRAFDPIYTPNINGTEKLVFKIFYHYRDNDGELVDNPIVPYLVNERKVKLWYKTDISYIDYRLTTDKTVSLTKTYYINDGDSYTVVTNPVDSDLSLYYEWIDPWHDFVIQQIEEDSENHTLTCTCVDLASAELAKTGYNLLFDSELENNQGTAAALTRATLEESDWSLGTYPVIDQTNNEALYKCTLRNDITAYKITDNSEVEFERGSTIYVYYNSFLTKPEERYQFIYVDTSEGQVIPLMDDRATIDTSKDNVYDVYYTPTYAADNKLPSEFNQSYEITKYRGDRLIRQQKSGYDPITDKQILKYYTVDGSGERNGEYYGYTESEYATSDIVQNYIANGETFTDHAGWYKKDANSGAEIEQFIYPQITKDNASTYVKDMINNAGKSTQQYKSYLRIKLPAGAKQNVQYFNNGIVNTGINDNRATIKNIVKGETYTFAFLPASDVVNATNANYKSLSVRIRPYNYDGTTYTFTDFKFQRGSAETLEGYDIFSPINIDNTNKFVARPPRDIYTLTTDQTVDYSKQYYQRADGRFVRVDNPVAADLANYYEMKLETWYMADMVANANISFQELLDNKIGIFIYTQSNRAIDIALEKVQLFKKVIIRDKQVYIGDIPTADIITYYNYYDPEQAKKCGDANLVSIISRTQGPDERFKPDYGDDINQFEKIRSIKESESCRYNILQTICETFECWVKFRVEHDKDGSIKIAQKPRYYPIHADEIYLYLGKGIFIYNQTTHEYERIEDVENISPNIQYYCIRYQYGECKYADIYETIIKDNYSGFKYGINLSTITRELNSEKIVTKIIVKSNVQEYAENGLVSIQLAADNPIKESYALDFDYYIQQGLINEDDINKDLYGSEDGNYVGLYPRLAEINKNLESLTEQYSLITSKEEPALESKVTVYQNAMDSAAQGVEDTRMKIEDLCSYTWSDLTSIYPEYRYTQDETFVHGKTYYEKQDNKTTVSTFNKVPDTDGRTGSPKQYGYFEANNRKQTLLEICSEDPTLNEKMTELLTQLNYYQAKYEEYKILYDLYNTSYNELLDNKDKIEAEMKRIELQSDAVEREFNTKYSRFIQEGSWTSDEYLDSNLYYLDSLNVLHTSAFPEVSYKIKVLELSELEEYANYHFSVGDKTTIEDTEFFGWSYTTITDATRGTYVLKTPIKEEVVLSEISYHLDEPSKNEITVQNYKTQFEDLFNRVAAATASLEYHEGDYRRAADAITYTGAIEEDSLQQALDNGSYSIQSANNQSVKMDRDGITIIDLADQSKRINLNNTGIKITSDGGETWYDALTGSGLNASTIRIGSLDSSTVTITNSGMPALKLDVNGLSAYSLRIDNEYIGEQLNEGEEAPLLMAPLRLGAPQDTDSEDATDYLFTSDNDNLFGRTGEIKPIIREVHPETFVRFDQFGMYGIENNQSYIPTYNNKTGRWDIEDNATFAFTWDGFFLKGNANGDNYVKISSDNGIEVMQQNGDELITMVKIGQLSEETDIYGIQIRDINNNTVMETGSDGQLWLRSFLRVGDENTPNVKLGFDNTVSYYDGSYTISTDTEFNPEHTYYIKLHHYPDNNNDYQYEYYEKAEITKHDWIPNYYYEKVPHYAVIQADSANNLTKFCVYDNGYVEAKGLNISGNIEAESGLIGNIDIRNGGLSSDKSVMLVDIQDQILVATMDDQYEEHTLFGLEHIFDLNEDGLSIYNGNIDIYDAYGNTVIGMDNNGNMKVSGTLTAAKIVAATFENDQVTVAGGQMIFKQSYRVKSNTTTEIVIDVDTEPSLDGYRLTDSNLEDLLAYETGTNLYIARALEHFADRFSNKNGMWVYLAGPDRIVKITPAVIRDNEIVVSLATLTNVDEQKQPMLSPGTVQNMVMVEYADELEDATRELLQENTAETSFLYSQDAPMIIGINSDANHNQLLQQQGITLTQFSVNNNKAKLTTRLFIGNLDTLDKDSLDFTFSRESRNNLKGYGLYADNVFLTGSIQTNGGEAGINTHSNVITQANDLLKLDNSPVVLWAGSDQPGQANFQVTRQGSIYANNGIFKGIIQSSEIYTSVIRGIGVDYADGTSRPALSIIDDQGYSGTGLVFIADETENVATLSIDSLGMHQGIDGKLIDIDITGNTYPEFYGNFNTNLANNNTYLHIVTTTNGAALSYIASDNTGQDGNMLYSLNFDTINNESQLSLNWESQNKMIVNNHNFDITSELIQLNGNLTVDNKLSYVVVSDSTSQDNRNVCSLYVME